MPSLFSDPLFKRIYKKWHSRKRRHPELNINVLEQAKKEYEWKKEMLEKNTLQKPPSYTPLPPDTDPTINICGTPMKDSEWRKLIRIQKEKGTSPTTTPDEELKRYLISLFRNDKPRRDNIIPYSKEWKLNKEIFSEEE